MLLPEQEGKGRTRLRDLDAAEVSFVSTGANRRKFLIFKRGRKPLEAAEKGGPGSGPQPGGGAGKSQEEHKKDFENSSKGKILTAGGAQFHSGGHTREEAKAKAGELRAQGIHGAISHVSGPKTGGKSNYAVVRPKEKVTHSAVRKDALTTQGREHIAEHNFAIPPDRYPIHDAAHARNALARSSGKPEEARVKAAVYRKYPSLKPDSTAKGGKEMPGDNHGKIRDMIAKTSPEIMAKVGEHLAKYGAVAKDGLDDGGGEQAVETELAGLDEATQAALKAVVRILVPFKDKISPVLLDEVLELAGFAGDEGDEMGGEDAVGKLDGVEGEDAVGKGTIIGNPGDVSKGFRAIPARVESEDEDVLPSGVKKSHFHEAVKSGNTAYNEHLEKLGYEKYPMAEMAQKNHDGQPVEKRKGEQVAKSGTDLSRVDPKTRAQIDQIFETNKELVAKNASLEARVAAGEAETRRKELVAKASGWTHLGLPQGDVLAQLLLADKAGKESLELVCKNFEAVNAQAKAGGLFGEVGSSQAGGGAGDPWAKIEALAGAYVAKASGKVSKADAVSAVLETDEGKKLYAEHQAARPKGI